MAETLRLEIVTPQAIAFSDDVEMVTLPAIEGEMGIYPAHVRLITQIVPGEIIVQAKDGQERSSPSAKGWSRSPPPACRSSPTWPSPPTRSTRPRSRRRARAPPARLREKISDEEVATVNASLVRSLAQLQVKKRRRT